MEERRSHSVWIAVALIALLLLPILYVLSVGPYAYFSDGAFSESAQWFYAPLLWLHDHSERFSTIFVWYLNLWT